MRMLLHERDPRHHRRAAEGLCLRGRAGDQAAHRPVSSVGGPKPTPQRPGPELPAAGTAPSPAPGSRALRLRGRARGDAALWRAKRAAEHRSQPTLRLPNSGPAGRSSSVRTEPFAPGKLAGKGSGAYRLTSASPGARHAALRSGGGTGRDASARLRAAPRGRRLRRAATPRPPRLGSRRAAPLARPGACRSPPSVGRGAAARVLKWRRCPPAFGAVPARLPRVPSPIPRGAERNFATDLPQLGPRAERWVGDGAGGSENPKPSRGAPGNAGAVGLCCGVVWV